MPTIVDTFTPPPIGHTLEWLAQRKDMQAINNFLHEFSSSIVYEAMALAAKRLALVDGKIGMCCLVLFSDDFAAMETIQCTTEVFNPTPLSRRILRSSNLTAISSRNDSPMRCPVDAFPLGGELEFGYDGHGRQVLIKVKIAGPKSGCRLAALLLKMSREKRRACLRGLGFSLCPMTDELLDDDSDELDDMGGGADFDGSLMGLRTNPVLWAYCEEELSSVSKQELKRLPTRFETPLTSAPSVTAANPSLFGAASAAAPVAAVPAVPTVGPPNLS